MSLALLLLFSIVFIESFLFLDLGSRARSIAGSARDALGKLRNTMLSDAEKEAIARKSARRIFAGTCSFLLRLSLILVALAAALFVADALDPAIGEELRSALASPPILAVLTVFAIAYGYVRAALLR